VSAAIASPVSASPPAPWENYHRRWRELGPPLRPHRDVVASIRAQLAGHDARVLLLGVTPELADLGQFTCAVDHSAGAAAHVWPGDTATRTVVRAEWQRIPCGAGSFSAAIGDGSLNCLAWPGGYVRLFDELARLVRPGGRSVLRVYVRPTPGEALDQVRAAVIAGDVGSVHALKWRIAMAICGEQAQANLEVWRISDAFTRLFPCRRELTRVTGWSEGRLAQMDVYAGVPDVYSFPSAGEITALFADGRVRATWCSSGSYELAERCPLVVLDMSSRPGQRRRSSAIRPGR
jgi:hypothetical protein